MIAQDYHRKGLAEAIAALARIQDKRLVLLVVGKQDPSAYRKLAQRQGVGDRVFFAGKTADPYAFYRSADMFVLPTRHDPCSLVVLEALAMGVPVISTIFNGACEIMEGGRHGFVLPDPADISALADSFRALLDDSARAAMSQECLGLRPRLAYDRHLDELMKIYERAVRRKSKNHVK
jgi:UDP-glucose:(heptosyl)LPS alpha-1,3-glucosyltransferase